jgi:uncharacterized protein
MTNYDRFATAQRSTGAVAQAEYDAGLRSYMLGIYNHMTLGVGITALFALGIGMLAFSADPTGAAGQLRNGTYVTALGAMLYQSPLRWVLMLAPLAFVFFISFRFEKMSYTTLLGTFWAFAATMGVSMGWIFGQFTGASIVQTFLVTAIAFAGLSLFGYTTKKDLSGWGKFLIMGLIGLIVASLINIFMQSSAMQFAINVIGLLIFAGLTAWDTQRLRQDYDYIAGNAAALAKHSLMGALGLYMNFINMFQFLLAFMGDRE